MTALDTNVLLYAYNVQSPHHVAVRDWLDRLIKSDRVIGLPWPVLWGFLRISTNPRVFSPPRPAGEIFAIIRDWVRQPRVVLLQPGARHWEMVERLVMENDAAGALAADAVLAALAMEQGAELASTDRDFSRFGGLRWINPAVAGTNVSL